MRQPVDLSCPGNARVTPIRCKLEVMQTPRRCFPHFNRWHNRLAFQLLDMDLMAIHSSDMGSDLDIFEA
jgi:hypothetical protein